MLPIPYLRCMTLPAFRAQLELDIERAQRYGRPLTVAILDLDRFRYLNMNRGYATGEIMRQHPVIGERIMRAMPGMGSIARVVRDEHERWDGGGYPDGLAGEAIPLAARIILACDAYHAMVSDRPYRKAMDHHDAMAELTANAGTQFDPEVVQSLVGYLVGRRQAGLEVV